MVGGGGVTRIMIFWILLLSSQLGLMDDSGNVREDLKLPSGHDDADALARQIQAQWDEGKELVLTVLKSMGEEQVNATKEAPKQD